MENSNGERTVNLSGEEYLKIGKVAQSFLEKGVSEDPPKLVIFMGGVAAGKTTIRRREYGGGYVHFDFGDIYTALKKAVGEEEPKLKTYATIASDMILRECLESRKNIVIEIIGETEALIKPVIDRVTQLGYNVSIRAVELDPQEAYKRHLKAVEEDPDYLSAFYTQETTLAFLYQQLDLGSISMPQPGTT